MTTTSTSRQNTTTRMWSVTGGALFIPELSSGKSVNNLVFGRVIRREVIVFGGWRGRCRQFLIQIAICLTGELSRLSYKPPEILAIDFLNFKVPN